MEDDPGGGDVPSTQIPRGNGKDAFQKSRKTMRSPTTKSPSSTIPDESNVTKGEQTIVRANAFVKLMRPVMSRLFSEQDLHTIELFNVSNENVNKGIGHKQSSADDDKQQLLMNSGKRLLSPNDEPKESKRMRTRPSALEKANTLIKELMVFASSHLTTARAIKNGITKMKSILDELTSDWKFHKPSEPSTDKMIEEKEMDVRTEMSENMDISAIDSLVAKNWPHKSYTHTTFNQRDLLEKPTLKSTLVNIINFQEDKNFQKLNQIVPETKDITAELLRNKGYLEISTNRRTVIPGLKSNTNSEKWYAIRPALEIKNGLISTADIINWMEATKKAVGNINKTTVEIFVPEETQGLERVRKILECVLYKTDIT